MLSRTDKLFFLPYLLAIAAWAELKTGHFWRYALPTLALFGMLAWWLNYRRYRLVADTPSSRIASAALGRVELSGRAFCHPGAPNISPLSGRRCVWYSCSQRRMERSPDWDWRRLLETETERERQTSDDSFLLRDGAAEALVLPEAAEVQASHSRKWVEDGYEFTESWIEEGEALYISGQLSALGGPAGGAAFIIDVGAKLAQWKQDPKALRLRFQLPDDGPFSTEEWEQVVQAAKREVSDSETAAAGPGLILQRAQDGLPMLISTLSAAQCARGFRLRAWLHAGLALLFLLLWQKYFQH
ncbi:hypothetical protein [Chromobacterium alticapitis]|uniref:RING-type E3 ubiquitin transferase n=1 Tax=Chromobacterium alticapitis TaxID=2073169 RepID=A0A2S5DAC1_9NEIS|nr:hypothetical protein [Chromobacterium alticapitis]POZ60035.1 hypothetical protein C2I19_21150 [Chromobacterium alticapitis]